jgi:PAS domain S-box-containing protein
MANPGTSDPKPADRLTPEQGWTYQEQREGRARPELESILESITDAFYAVDRDWRFTYVNRRAEEILHRRREELIGRSLWEDLPELIGTRFDREYHRSMAEQTTAEFEAYYPPLGIWVEVRAYPSPELLSVYLRDITDRKRAEQALRESEERYRLLADLIPQHIWTTDPNGYHRYFSRRWYDFTGATLEETEGDRWLRFMHPDDSIFQREYHRAVAEQTTVEFEAYAPTVRLWVDVRAYPSGDGLSVFFRDVTARKLAEANVRESIQRSLHLIHELLELARAEAGQIELEPAPTDIAELAREAAEDFRAQATAAGLGLEVRVAGTLPIQTDPTRVRQILSNLLSNAVKYTAQGRITVEAGLRTSSRGPRDADCVAIDVTDTGPGIPAEKTELIFQEFTRLDPEAQHGAGVGLAISRRIARLLGGDITLESQIDHGSTFTLWLPWTAPEQVM